MKNSTSPVIEIINSVFFFSYLFIFAIGVPGNILMFVVFSRSTLTKLSVSVYFRAMAIANLAINFTLVKQFAEDQYNYNISDRSIFICKLYNYLIYSVSSMAVWFLAAAGFDRYLIIAHPARFQFFHKNRFPFYITIALIAFNMLFYILVIFDSNLINQSNDDANNATYQTCLFENYGFLLVLCDFFNSTIVPFMIMIFTTIGMILVVNKSRRRMKKFEQARPNHLKKGCRNLKFGASLIITNIVFLILITPISISDLGFLNFDFEFDFGIVVLIMYSSYYSIEFYLQVAVNNLVRNEFVDMFKKLW